MRKRSETVRETIERLTPVMRVTERTDYPTMRSEPRGGYVTTRTYFVPDPAGELHEIACSERGRDHHLYAGRLQDANSLTASQHGTPRGPRDVRLQRAVVDAREPIRLNSPFSTHSISLDSIGGEGPRTFYVPPVQPTAEEVLKHIPPQELERASAYEFIVPDQKQGVPGDPLICEVRLYD